MPATSELVYYRGHFQEDQPISSEQPPLSERAQAWLDHVKTAAKLRYGEAAAKDALEQPWTLVELPEGYGIEAICILGSETATYEPVTETFGLSGLGIRFKHPESCHYDETVINIVRPYPAIRSSPYAHTLHADSRFVSKPPDRGSRGDNLELVLPSFLKNALDDARNTWSVQRGVIIGMTESLERQLCEKYSLQDDSFHLPVNFLYVTGVSPKTPSQKVPQAL